MNDEEIEASDQVIKWIPWKFNRKNMLFDPKSKISLERKRIFTDLKRVNDSANFSCGLKNKIARDGESRKLGMSQGKYLSFDGEGRRSFLNDGVGKRKLNSLSPSKKPENSYLNKAIFTVNERDKITSIKLSSVNRKILLPYLNKFGFNSVTPNPYNKHIIPEVRNADVNTSTIYDEFYLDPRY